MSFLARFLEDYHGDYEGFQPAPGAGAGTAGDDSHDDHNHDGHDHGSHEGHDRGTEDVDAFTATSDGSGTPWGDIILGSFLIQLVTLTGLALTAFSICAKRNDSLYNKMMNTAIPSFAAGALMATTVFLILPESIYLITGIHAGHGDHSDHSDHDAGDDDHAGHNHFRSLVVIESGEETESGAAWKFGVAILGGYLFPIITKMLFPVPDSHDLATVGKKDEDETLSKASPENPVDDSLDKNCEEGKQIDSASLENKAVKRDHALASSILIGDAFHNLADGIFVGNAFLLCGRSFTYTVIAATIYHELAQEIADYALLVHHCGLSRVVALTANFLSGFSVFLGAALVAAMDLSSKTTGILLAISAGVYLNVAASECVPRIEANRKSARDTLEFLMLFALGAVPIGLVLLNHGHCDAH